MDTLGIFGMGYVGTEVAKLGGDAGLELVGFDVSESVVQDLRTGDHDRELNEGDIEMMADGTQVARNADILVVAVPTPLDSNYVVNLSPLRSAIATIADGIDEKDKNQPLVVVESTIPPGTIQNVVAEEFEMRNLAVGQDFYLAHVPERITPGDDEWPLARIPRVAGAMSSKGLVQTVAFYEQLIDADIHPVETPEIAESAKIIENAFRDVNIAFVNEIALSLDKLGIDATAALDAAATKPFGFVRFEPGAGVGGHCIPVDPYLLINEAEQSGFDHRFLRLARRVNERMPQYVVEKTIKGLNAEGILPRDAEVLLLGKAFKANVSDARNSPYFTIRSELEEYGCTVQTYDPKLPDESTVDSIYTDVDAIIVVTGHDEFCTLDPSKLASLDIKVLIDGRNVLDRTTVEGAGLYYAGVGN